MYIPDHFSIKDTDEIDSFIRNNAFGQLISNLEGRIFSTYMPFILSEDQVRITGHVAKSNPQHPVLNGQEVLITLEGPHNYVSPSWYEGPGVPTWNYQAVHIYGEARVFTDTDRLKTVVDTLTSNYECSLPEPWEPKYKASALNAIIGVEVIIREIQCKYKLSQNRTANDRKEVIRQLKTLGNLALAEEMELHTEL
jgi:transcriptional regulator